MTSLGSAWASLLPRLGGRTAVDQFPGVGALLDAYVRNRKLAGAVAAVGDHEESRFFSSGRVAFEETARSAGADSLWRIYSLTKLVTGAAAMVLIDEGSLDLETPVAKFFSTFAASRVLAGPGGAKSRRARSPVTVRHLMTHTSGLVGSLVPEPPLSDFYRDRRLNVSRVSLEADIGVSHQKSLVAYGEAAGTVPLAFEPGTAWSYGISSDVLGAVIEKASGLPFERFLESRLFHPLGMRETGFVVRSADLDRFATNYQVTSSGLDPVDAPPRTIFAKAPPFPYPSSGLVSSARDFARFARMLLCEGLLDGARVLSTRSARLMMSNLLPSGVTALGEGWGAGGLVILTPDSDYGPVGRTRGTYGWEGAAGTVCWVDRVTGIHAVLMTQFMPNRAYALHTEFTRAILSGARPLIDPGSPAASGP